MPLPRLLVITDWRLPAATLLSRLEAVLSLGARVGVQHRHPEASGRVFFEEARVVAAIAQRHGAPLFVNGRLDVALLLGAHLHVGADAVTPAEATRHLPPERWVSVAVHSREEATNAKGADLALVSPIFPAGSKVGDARPCLGPSGFSVIRAALPCPAYALGGIGPETLTELPDAEGAAAISSLLTSSDPRGAALALLARLPP